MSTLTPPSPPPAPPDPRVMLPLTFDRKRRITDADLEPIITGKVWPPNYEPIEDADRLLGALLQPGGVRKGQVLLPGMVYPHDAVFSFPYDVISGGGLGVFAYTTWRDGKYTGRGGRFALCKHEKIEGAGANHQRGWHPGHCKLCGVDMSYDSGD